MKKVVIDILKKSKQISIGMVCILGSILSVNTATAQIDRFAHAGLGVTLDSYVSGNAHGGMYSGSINYTKNKATISMGPCIQKRHMKFCGGKIALSYLLNAPKIRRTKLMRSSAHASTDSDQYEDEDDELAEDMAGAENLTEVSGRSQIKLLVFAQYVQNASFSYAAEKMEYHVNRVENMNWKAVTLTTLECGMGFEINTRLVRNVYLKNYITATLFDHTKYVQNMQHDQHGLTLTLGTAITIPYFR